MSIIMRIGECLRVAHNAETEQAPIPKQLRQGFVAAIDIRQIT
jgi:hypothetical protein